MPETMLKINQSAKVTHKPAVKLSYEALKGMITNMIAPKLNVQLIRTLNPYFAPYMIVHKCPKKIGAFIASE